MDNRVIKITTIDKKAPISSFVPDTTCSYISSNYITSQPGISTLRVPDYYNCITAYAIPTPPEPKLDAIKCPGCGQGNIKKTGIDGIVECTYCGRQFTLRY